MRTNELTTITIIILLAGLLSCQKKATVATSAASDEISININAPLEGSTYKKGDTVYINAEISYTGQLHGYIMQITMEDGTVLFEAEGHSHSDKISVAEKWCDTLSYAAPLNMVLVAVIDHDENPKITKVGFKSQP